MSGERLLLDTVFIQALLNRHDQYHTQATALFSRVRNASAQFIEQCYNTTNMHVVSVDTPLLLRALRLYRSRLDKTWGLTDCMSFVVMQEHGLTVAVTADQHFVQAGSSALLLAA